MTTDLDARRPWYDGITKYQWLVLLIASLGWIFDIFEGQIFVASMREAMPSLLPSGTSVSDIGFFNNLALGSFLVGGAVGGIFFGMLSDRIGRTKTMILTILMYSLFTCVTAFSQEWWHMVILRFFVAMGVGGEWAVASAMVAEVFPKRARAWSLGIFHATSVFGTYLAIGAGALIVGNPRIDPELGWRLGFAIGALPALLTLWIRWKLREPEKWVEARKKAQEDSTQKTGRLLDLFAADLRRNTLVGISLAVVGMATFWGVHIYGKNVMLAHAERPYLEQLPDDADATQKRAVLDELSPDDKSKVKNWEMLGMFLVTTGGGLGLLCFGPMSDRIGRRPAFVVYHALALVCALVLFQGMGAASPRVLYIALPIFGFWTLGMHAGYAVYFPELFPTRLRGTGGGVCFNGGRILAAPILFLIGWMQTRLQLPTDQLASILSVLYLVGIVVALMGPETKDQELPT